MLSFVFAIVAGTPSLSEAQDEFNFTADAYIGLLPMRLTGTLDVGDRSETIINSKAVVSHPVYRQVDTLALAYTGVIHGGVNIPFYRTDNWSIGAKLSLGFGIMGGIRAAEGLQSLAFDFPEFIYYRNYSTAIDFSVLLGYKYTLAALPYALPIVAADLNIDEHNALRLYGSPIRYKYYTLYTNGELVPFLQIAEIGFGYVLSF